MQVKPKIQVQILVETLDAKMPWMLILKLLIGVLNKALNINIGYHVH